MFFKTTLVLALLFFASSGTEVTRAQGKKHRKPVGHKMATPKVMPKYSADTATRPQDDVLDGMPKATGDVSSIKETLVDDYWHSGKVKRKDTTIPGKKLILNVGWFDTDFQKISQTVRDEMISLAVLTKGYNMGDTVRITIDSHDTGSLVAGRSCNAVTFIGIVNYKDLAFLQDVFSVQGEEEQMVIDEKWLDRYICK